MSGSPNIGNLLGRKSKEHPEPDPHGDTHKKGKQGPPESDQLRHAPSYLGMPHSEFPPQGYSSARKTQLVTINWEHLKTDEQHPLDRLRAAREETRKQALQTADMLEKAKPFSRHWKTLLSLQNQHLKDMEILDRVIKGEDVPRLEGRKGGPNGRNLRMNGRRWVDKFMAKPHPADKTIASAIASSYKRKYLEYRKSALTVPLATKSAKKLMQEDQRQQHNAHQHRQPGIISQPALQPGPSRNPQLAPSQHHLPLANPFARFDASQNQPAVQGPAFGEQPVPARRLSPSQHHQPLTSPFAQTGATQYQHAVPSPAVYEQQVQAHQLSPHHGAPGTGDAHAPGPHAERQDSLSHLDPFIEYLNTRWLDEKLGRGQESGR